MTRIWIDIINPSHALFFNSLIPELSSHQLDITIRDRAETVKLCKSFGINGRVIGTDYVDPLNKSAYMVYRTLKLVTSVPQFDISISFENGMCVFGSRIRGNPSILFCDNDLKFSQKKILCAGFGVGHKEPCKLCIHSSSLQREFQYNV